MADQVNTARDWRILAEDDLSVADIQKEIPELFKND